MKTKLWVVLFSIAAWVIFSPVMADTDSKKLQALTKEVRALKAQVDALQKSVAVLEAMKPTVTGLMPSFSERFHVMHYAGEAGDWAVAAHELLAMREMVEVISAVDPEKGALMQGFMTGSFNKINAAIEHGNGKSFNQALDDTVKNCNACHDAVGSKYIQVTLDAKNSLSMRHSHKFIDSEMMGKHMHNHN